MQISVNFQAIFWFEMKRRNIELQKQNHLIFSCMCFLNSIFGRGELRLNDNNFICIPIYNIWQDRNILFFKKNSKQYWLNENINHYFGGCDQGRIESQWNRTV